MREGPASGMLFPIDGCEWHFAFQGDADRIWMLFGSSSSAPLVEYQGVVAPNR